MLSKIQKIVIFISMLQISQLYLGIITFCTKLNTQTTKKKELLLNKSSLNITPM